MPLQNVESKQKLVLRSCGIQHPHLHLPWAAFEDAGFFCIMFEIMDQVHLPGAQPQLRSDSCIAGTIWY